MCYHNQFVFSRSLITSLAFCFFFKKQMDVGVRIQVEKAMTKIKPAVESAASIARSIRDRCDYGWVQLTDIAI